MRSCVEVPKTSKLAKNGYCDKNVNSPALTNCYYNYDLATGNAHLKAMTTGKAVIFCPVCYYIEGAQSTNTHKSCLKPDGIQNPMIKKISCLDPSSSDKTMRCGTLEGTVTYEDAGPGQYSHPAG